MNTEKKKTLAVCGAAAVLVAGGALALYAALAGTVGGQGTPTVTSSPVSAQQVVDELIASVADNGKTYSYYWPAEHIEEQIELSRQSSLRSIEEQRARLPEMDRQMRTYHEQAIQQQEDELEGCLADERKGYEEAYRRGTELSVLSAQEAANMGGSILEERYGLNLSETTLQIECVEDWYFQKLVWLISVEAASLGKESASVVLDAATGECLSAEYFPATGLSEEEMKYGTKDAA